MNKKYLEADRIQGWETGKQGLLAIAGRWLLQQQWEFGWRQRRHALTPVTHLCRHLHQLGEAARRGGAGIPPCTVALRSCPGPSCTQ